MTGAQLLERAAPFVRAQRCPPGRVLQFRGELLGEETQSVAVLALLEHKDPAAAVETFLRAERDWINHAAPLLESLDD